MNKITEETPLKKIYDKLYGDKKVKSQSDFAAQLKYHATPVSMMLTGKKPMPYKFLVALYKIYNVNVNYLISKGSGNMFLDGAEKMSRKDYEAAEAIKERNIRLEKENEDLKQRIADKDKIIRLLEKNKP